MTTPTPTAGLDEGLRRRDRALDRLGARRPALVRRIQREYLTILLRRGPTTTDPVRAAVPIPDGCDPRLVGAAVHQLARLGIIRGVGWSRSVRPEAHGRDIRIWAITDRAGAISWLADHPELDDPAAAPGHRSLSD